MKKLLLLIACACIISINAMEPESETPSREDLPVFAYPGLQARQASSGYACFYKDFQPK